MNDNLAISISEICNLIENNVYFRAKLSLHTRSVQKVRGLLLKCHFPLSEWNKNWLNASSMYPGFSNIFKRINRRRKMCKIVTMTTQDSHHGALQNFPFFFIAVPALFVCAFDQSEFNILKLMFLKEHLYFDMSVKFNKFLKNDLENIEN